VAPPAVAAVAAVVVTVEPIKEPARITFYYLHNPLKILVHGINDKVFFLKVGLDERYFLFLYILISKY
jgi:hypothetical protein